jgi:hypothetical protein
LSLAHALSSRRLEVDGEMKKQRALKSWLNPSPLTAVKSVRAEMQAAE